MRVRAIQRGYYGNLLRRPGDVFTLARAEEFSPRWMTPVSDQISEQRTNAQQALRADYERSHPLGTTRRVCEPVDPDEDRADTEFDPFT